MSESEKGDMRNSSTHSPITTIFCTSMFPFGFEASFTTRARSVVNIHRLNKAAQNTKFTKNWDGNVSQTKRKWE